MNTQIIRGSEVSRPTTTPLGSSITDHASGGGVLQSFGLRNDEGIWPTYNEVDTLTPAASCDNPDAGPDYKTFARGYWVDAFTFSVQAGVQCAAIGLDANDMQSEMKRVFEANEGRGIEEQILVNRFNTAVDLTPGVELDLPMAIGAAEGYMARHYAGVPTIHMPRAFLTPAIGLGLIVEGGGKFFTRAGSKVAAGGGYDTGTGSAPEAIYATGEVWYEKSSDVDIRTFVSPVDGSGTGSDENGLPASSVIALVERMYRVAIEGPIISVSVKGWLS